MMKNLTLSLLAAVCFVSSLSAKQVLAFAGSVREDSCNEKLVRLAAKIDNDIELISLKDYPAPIYDGDLEAQSGLPVAIEALQKKILDSDVVVISTPEYNGAVPPLLKNTIDWLSRGKIGQKVFKDRKFILLSASPGRGGGSRAVANLRSILEALNANVSLKTFSLPNAYSAFNADGNLKEPSQHQKLVEALR